MGNSTRICRVCGKEYPYCKTILKDGDIFRWQDVACCQEHGSEYFAQISASRIERRTIAEDKPIMNGDLYLDDECDDEDDPDDDEYDFD